jgi:hypothetical protein
MLTVRGETKTVKGDNQTIHLMAKVDNQNPSTDPPSEPQQQPNQPQTASIGFNTSILANQISNLTGLRNNQHAWLYEWRSWNIRNEYITNSATENCPSVTSTTPATSSASVPTSTTTTPTTAALIVPTSEYTTKCTYSS